MKYPRRYKYKGVGSHIRWMRDIMKWRKWNRMSIARLG